MIRESVLILWLALYLSLLLLAVFLSFFLFCDDSLMIYYFCQDVMKSRDQVLRKAEQENDSLSFRNQQLTKRLTLLQEDLDEIEVCMAWIIAQHLLLEYLYNCYWIIIVPFLVHVCLICIVNCSLKAKEAEGNQSLL